MVKTPGNRVRWLSPVPLERGCFCLSARLKSRGAGCRGGDRSMCHDVDTEYMQKLSFRPAQQARGVGRRDSRSGLWRRFDSLGVACDGCQQRL